MKPLVEEVDKINFNLSNRVCESDSSEASDSDEYQNLEASGLNESQTTDSLYVDEKKELNMDDCEFFIYFNPTEICRSFIYDMVADAIILSLSDALLN